MPHINNINCFNNNSTKPNTSHPTPNNQQPASNVCADKLTDSNINIFPKTHTQVTPAGTVHAQLEVNITHPGGALELPVK